MVIGLTGTNGAGKTVAAEHLRSIGFVYHSLSDEIRTELEGQDRELTRENLIAMGNQLRADYGPTVLAERVKERLRPDRHYVMRLGIYATREFVNEVGREFRLLLMNLLLRKNVKSKVRIPDISNFVPVTKWRMKSFSMKVALTNCELVWIALSRYT